MVRFLRQAQGERYAGGLVQRAQLLVAIQGGAGAGAHALAGILYLRGRPGGGRFARNEFSKADGFKRTPQQGPPCIALVLLTAQMQDYFDSEMLVASRITRPVSSG